jgi:threonine dehydratase
MPDTSAQVKIDAVREFGATVDLIDTKKVTREGRVAEIAAGLDDAYVASPFDDPLVIEGNASLGREIANCGIRLDAVICPVGGGGIASGLAVGLSEAVSSAALYGAEPLIANDAARSLREGHIVVNETEPQTIADGARTRAIGKHNWPILRERLSGIVEVPEDAIRQATRDLYLLANLKSEPTGALGIGALATAPERFGGKTVCCVVTGGNVDAGVYAKIITE